MYTQQKKYFENLDALRFIAFLLVFLPHAVLIKYYPGDPFLTNWFAELKFLGRIGVDFFFVLSSFLITWIIEEEYSLSQKFSAGNFLIRRSLRIWPLYFLIVLSGYSVILLQQEVLKQVSSHPNPNIWWFISFTINFYITEHGQSFLFFLVFLWSIAIEEQFYLAWAFVMKLLRKYYPVICIFLLGASLLFRIMNLDKNLSLYFHTLSAVGNFATGALTAYISFHRKGLFTKLIALNRTWICAVYIILLLFIIFYRQIFSVPLTVVTERLLFSILFAFVIFEQCFSDNSFYKAGRFRLINYGGKISYGLYCYHGVVITAATYFLSSYNRSPTALQTFIIIPSAIFIATFMISSLSFEIFEKPFLRWRRRFYSK